MVSLRSLCQPMQETPSANLPRHIAEIKEETRFAGSPERGNGGILKLIVVQNSAQASRLKDGSIHLFVEEAGHSARINLNAAEARHLGLVLLRLSGAKVEFDVSMDGLAATAEAADA